MDNFNTLLNIYKMNPLKNSKVFNTFSNSILLPRPDELRPALNNNSDESSFRYDSDFKRIEETQRSTKPPLDESELILTDLSAIFNSTFDKITYNRMKNIHNSDLEQNSPEILRRDQVNSRRNVRLKVYDLNAKSEDNNVNYIDAGVVIVK